MNLLPDRLILITENGSRYKLDTVQKKISKLFREPMLGKGSETLEDGVEHSYAAIHVLEEGKSLVLFWPNGKALLTSRVTSIIELSG